MSYSVEVSEPNLGRTTAFRAPTATEALEMARWWFPNRVTPSVSELIRAGKEKPPTQGIVAQGFEAFGPMGGKAA